MYYRILYGPIQPVEAELLTMRQREISHLIVAGQSNQEIARQLGIRESNVKIHVALFDRLGVRHRSAVALAGVKLGLWPSAAVFAPRGRKWAN